MADEEYVKCNIKCDSDVSCLASCYDERAEFLSHCPCGDKCPADCPCPSFDCGLLFPACTNPNQNADVMKCQDLVLKRFDTCIIECALNMGCIENCEQMMESEIENCPCGAKCPAGCPCPGFDCDLIHEANDTLLVLSHWRNISRPAVLIGPNGNSYEALDQCRFWSKI